MTENKTQARILMVLPTLGQRPDLLKQTLESIKQQSPVPYDIVMVFPLKDSVTKSLANEYDAMMVDDPGGLSKAVNAGIAQAQPHHEYIGWIGDDDLLTADSLAAGMEALDKNPKAVLSFGYCDYIDSNGHKLFTSRAGRLAPWIMGWGPNLVPCPGIVFRRRSLAEAGEFDPNNKYSMDLDMLLRLRKLGKFSNAKRVQAAFRWHEDSTTVSNRAHVIKETELVKRKYLPKPLLPLAPVWELPVRAATHVAARRVSKLPKS